MPLGTYLLKSVLGVTFLRSKKINKTLLLTQNIFQKVVYETILMILIIQNLLITDQIKPYLMSILLSMSIRQYDLHSPSFEVVLHLQFCCYRAQKGFLWVRLQVLFIVLAIQNQRDTALVL